MYVLILHATPQHVTCRISGKRRHRLWCRLAHPTGSVSGLWTARLAGAKRSHRGDFHGREHCPQLLPAPRVRAAAREDTPRRYARAGCSWRLKNKGE